MNSTDFPDFLTDEEIFEIMSVEEEFSVDMDTFDDLYDELDEEDSDEDSDWAE
jgi:hypothetical protein